jgi:FtsZ-interacting cell division protein ZipA
MKNSNTIATVLIVLAALVIIGLLIWKNKKDKKLLNPDADDAMEESRMDHERGRDKI